MGFFAEAGPLQIFVSSHVRVICVPAIGGQQQLRQQAALLVSSLLRSLTQPPTPNPQPPNPNPNPTPQLIPEDYEYSSANDAAYVSRIDGVRIEERAEVRVRIVGVRIDAAELVRGAGLCGVVGWRRVGWESGALVGAGGAVGVCVCVCCCGCTGRR